MVDNIKAFECIQLYWNRQHKYLDSSDDDSGDSDDQSDSDESACDDDKSDSNDKSDSDN